MSCTNLHSVPYGTGLYTSSVSGKTAQGLYGSYKNHLGHATIPSDVKTTLTGATNVSATITLRRENSAHGTAGQGPYPAIKLNTATQSASSYKFARGETRTFALSSTIVAQIVAGQTDLQFNGTGSSQYAFFDVVQINVTYTK